MVDLDSDLGRISAAFILSSLVQGLYLGTPLLVGRYYRLPSAMADKVLQVYLGCTSLTNLLVSLTEAQDRAASAAVFL